MVGRHGSQARGLGRETSHWADKAREPRRRLDRCTGDGGGVDVALKSNAHDLLDRDRHMKRRGRVAVSLKLKVIAVEAEQIAGDERVVGFQNIAGPRDDRNEENAKRECEGSA